VNDKNRGNLKSATGDAAYDRFDLLKLLADKRFEKEAKIIEKFYTVEEHKFKKSNKQKDSKNIMSSHQNHEEINQIGRIFMTIC